MFRQLPGLKLGGGNNGKKEKRKADKEKKKAAKIAPAKAKPGGEKNNNNNGNNNNQKQEPLTASKLYGILNAKLNSVKSEIKGLEENAAKVAAVQGSNPGKSNGQWSGNKWSKDEIAKQPCVPFQLQLCPFDKNRHQRLSACS